MPAAKYRAVLAKGFTPRRLTAFAAATLVSILTLPDTASARLSDAVPAATPSHAPKASATESATEASPHTPSRIEHDTFASSALGREWAYAVYLPPGYKTGGARYPVLYLLHGNAGHADDWLTPGNLQSAADALIDSGRMPATVIVMPEGGTDWYVDRKENLETAFFDNLLPHVEARFAVSRERSGRAIGGISMGGFGTLRYAMTRPDRFCGAFLLSPAIYPVEPPPTSAARRVGVFGQSAFDLAVWHALNWPAQWQHYFSQPYRLPVFIAAGDDELVIENDSMTLYTALRRANNPAALRVTEGGHTWDTWRPVLPEALAYTMQCTRRPVMTQAPAAPPSGATTTPNAPTPRDR